MRIFLDAAIEPVWGRYPRLQAEARARNRVVRGRGGTAQAGQAERLAGVAYRCGNASV